MLSRIPASHLLMSVLSLQVTLLLDGEMTRGQSAPTGMKQIHLVRCQTGEERSDG